MAFETLVGDRTHRLARACVHHAASEGSGSASIAGGAASPRVFVARNAVTADARWKPEVRACDVGAPPASRWFVRLVDTAVKIASPSAPPSCCDALSSAAASPALSAGTPAFAAVVTPTKTPPPPSARMSVPGSRSATYEPSTGMRDSQYSPPAATIAPTMITGLVPTRERSWEEMPALTATAKQSGRYARPVLIAEEPRTFCM